MSTKPSRHIDEALDIIDRLLGPNNEKGKKCQLCGNQPKTDRVGLCVRCIRSLKEPPASAPAEAVERSDKEGQDD